MAVRLLRTIDLEHRVRAHGGILEAIEFGIRADAIEDPEMATVWRGIEEQYDELRENLVFASRILNRAQRVA